MIRLFAPLAVVALQLLFTRTELGRTIRAAAANPEAARLAGISVRRTSTTVWVIAGVLSTLTAILQAPQISGLDVSNLGPTLLVRGAHSPLLTAPVAVRMQAAIPNCALVEIAGGGHWVHLEEPEAFARTLDVYL